MATAEKVNKSEVYRQTFKDMGLDVAFADFAAHIKKKHDFEVPASAFYSIRTKLQGGTAAGGKKRGRKAAPPTPSLPTTTSPSAFSVSDLPAVLGDVRKVIAQFGGDKESLMRTIATL